jgi:hypothetical protein
MKRWFASGTSPKSYNVRLDSLVYQNGHKCVLIESVADISEGFETAMQYCSALDYAGKKIKMTGYIKSENVTDWAGMWLRVDGKTDPSLAFDNMQDRPVKGTSDWTKCEIILDVPKEAWSLNFGALISSTGKIWFDNVSFEIIDNTPAVTSQVTGQESPLPKAGNLDFEE